MNCPCNAKLPKYGNVVLTHKINKISHEMEIYYVLHYVNLIVHVI